MDPVYGFVPSYPYQRGPVHHRPYYSNTESIPTPVYADQAPFPMNYECCPWGGNYGYPYPVYGHGCCNHGHYPSHYSWRPPYSHLPPVHCHGNYPYPPFQSTHPNPYVPSPDYSIGHPRYEYEKNMPKDHHCCGCPNHTCNKREEKNVRIEEEDPDREKKNNESLVPLQFKNFPVVWFPPEYSCNKEDRNSNDSKVTDQENPNDSTKSIEWKPAIWNGWSPHNMSNLGSPKKNGGNQGRNKNQQDDDKGNFPFPIFWMPYKPEETENEREVKNVGLEPSKESIKLPDHRDNLKANKEQTNQNVPPRTKDIPVKQVEEVDEKGNSGDHKAKENNASGKDTKENGEKKSSEGSAKRKSPSPPKASKLPPVCLRVDPLPRRKNANGSSRSPSPPGSKRKLNESSNKASTVEGPKEIVANVTKDSESKEETTKAKTVEVMEEKSEQGANVERNTTGLNLPVTLEKDVQANQTDERSTEEKHSGECSRANKADVAGQSDDAGSQMVEKEEISRAKEGVADEAKELERMKLTDLEAAITIQSAYRGFAIRRWEPLKKLKQIANVREQIPAIKLLIQEMVSSSDIHRDYKKIHMIGETIMNLLLKLDTVQGLHPSARDIRKSVARELAGLQEKLDSLLNRNPEVSLEHEATNRGALEETKGDGAIQGKPCVENRSVDRSLSTNTDEARGRVAQSCNDQVDGGSQSENVERLDAKFVEEQLRGNVENESTEILANCGTEQIQEGGPEAELRDEKNCELQEDLNLISVPLTESGQEMADMSPSELDELPGGVLDDDTKAQGCMEHLQFISGELEVAENEVKGDAERVKEIEEGSMSEIVSIELKDNGAHDENKENVEMPVEVPSKQDDIRVHAEEKETSLLNESARTCNADTMIGSKEEVEGELEDDGAPSDENSCQSAENTGAKVNELKEADDMSGKALAAEDKLVDDVANSDEYASQPCIVGPNNDEPQGIDVKTESENVVDNQLGDTQDDIPVEVVEEKAGDVIAESDECAFQVPQDTGSYIQEPKGAEEKVQPEEIVENKLGDAIAESDDYTSSLPQNAQGKINETTGALDEINETTGALDEQKLQIGENPSQEEDDPKNSTESDNILDVSMESKSSIAQEDNAKKLQLGEHIEVQDSEVSEVENEQISPASPTARQLSLDFTDTIDSNKKLVEENEKLRETMEKLIKAGQEQLTTISSLSGRVNYLEKQLSRRKKLKTKRVKVPSPGSSCKKPSQDYFKGGYTGVAM